MSHTNNEHKTLRLWLRNPISLHAMNDWACEIAVEHCGYEEKVENQANEKELGDIVARFVAHGLEVLVRKATYSNAEELNMCGDAGSAALKRISQGGRVAKVIDNNRRAPRPWASGLRYERAVTFM